MPQEFPSSNLVTTYNYLDFPGNGNCRFADCPGKWQMKVRKEELAKKMLDFEWESSEVATVNAVREVVAPGSGKFPATNHPTHSSSLGCSNETCKLLKCSPTTSTIVPQRSISRAAELCQVLHLVCRHRAQSESSDSVL